MKYTATITVEYEPDLARATIKSTDGQITRESYMNVTPFGAIYSDAEGHPLSMIAQHAFYYILEVFIAEAERRKDKEQIAAVEKILRDAQRYPEEGENKP